MSLWALGLGCLGLGLLYSVAERLVTEAYSHRRACRRGNTVLSANNDLNQNLYRTRNSDSLAHPVRFSGSSSFCFQKALQPRTHDRPRPPFAQGSLFLSVLLSSHPSRSDPCQSPSSALAPAFCSRSSIRPVWPRSQQSGDAPKAVPPRAHSNPSLINTGCGLITLGLEFRAASAGQVCGRYAADLGRGGGISCANTLKASAEGPVPKLTDPPLWILIQVLCLVGAKE